MCPPLPLSFDVLMSGFIVSNSASNIGFSLKVAIKIIDKSKLDKANLEKVHREVEVMKLLNHPNIIKLFQVMMTKNMIYIVSEYAPCGEIFGKPFLFLQTWHHKKLLFGSCKILMGHI